MLFVKDFLLKASNKDKEKELPVNTELLLTLHDASGSLVEPGMTEGSEVTGLGAGPE